MGKLASGSSGSGAPVPEPPLELRSTPGEDWAASIRHTVQFDADVLHVERVSFWSFSEATSSIRDQTGYVVSTWSFERGRTLYDSDAPEYFAALRRGDMLFIDDVESDPRCRGLLEYCRTRGISSMLDVPVWVKGRLAGVLCHEHVGPKRTWTSHEADLAVAASHMVASALAARADTRAELAAFRASFLDDLSQGLFRFLDSHEIASRAADLVLPTLGQGSIIWTLNGDGVLEWRAANYTDPERRASVIEAIRTVALESGASTLAKLVTLQHQSVLVSELTPAVLDAYAATDSQRALLSKLEIRTAMAVPLAVADNPFGVMVFFASERQFDADDLDLAREATDRIAAALENARLYSLAREAIRARDDLLVLTAHELRTPLTALRLSADASLERARASGNRCEEKRWDRVDRQVHRLGSLVERLLEALRFRAEGIALARGPCALAEVADRSVNAVKERAHLAGSTIVLRVQAASTGLWDGPRLERVVTELLDNAIKFGAKKPIEVVVDRDGSHAVLTVRDHGPGIAPDRVAGIFAPFERAVPKEHFGGLGLGLYLAKTIVDAHHGSLLVQSRPGEGATFVVRLPLADHSRDEERDDLGVVLRKPTTL
jgi:signal transduction histidine kinase